MEKNMAEEKFLIENYGKRALLQAFFQAFPERREFLSGVIM